MREYAYRMSQLKKKTLTIFLDFMSYVFLWSTQQCVCRHQPTKLASYWIRLHFIKEKKVRQIFLGHPVLRDDAGGKNGCFKRKITRMRSLSCRLEGGVGRGGGEDEPPHGVGVGWGGCQHPYKKMSMEKSTGIEDNLLYAYRGCNLTQCCQLSGTEIAQIFHLSYALCPGTKIFG